MAEIPSSRALKDFLGEAEEIIEKLNLDLVGLGDCVDSGDVDPELLNSIFRGAHSLKGISGMFGFDDISELSHHMENLLDSLRLGKLELRPSLLDVLFGSLDILSQLVGAKGGSEDVTVDLSSILARINNELHGDVGTAENPLKKLNIDPAILNVLTEYEEHRLLENLKKKRNLLRVKVTFSLASFDQDLAEITDILKKQGEVISTLPCAGDISDRIAFQLLVGTTITVEKLRTLLNQDGLQIESLFAAPQSPLPEPVAIRETSDGALQEEGAEGGGTSLRSISRTVRVDIDKLDALMNVVGELVLSKGAIVNICDQLRQEGNNKHLAELHKATRTLERRLEELQKGVMEVRMVPVIQLFEKMTRIVRRVASEQNKNVGLDIRGADTELDKLIMEDLADPLMHIIRNAIDHGIETPEERSAAGKSPRGTICLWASQKGNHVVIEVRDDGRGIDGERVRKKALEQGLIQEGAELTRDDIFELLLTPGFSTRDEVSDLSGRGVGMDVVKNNIASMSGMVEMNSEPGEGTVMTITLPITLAIIKALIVRVCSKTYAIPINSVMETLMIEPGSIRTIERREVIELRQSTLPLLRLGNVFDLPDKARKNGRSFVAVIGLAEKKVGFVVDELLGQQDVVIKSLGSTLSFVRGVAGAADLGNQKTILVLDVGGLMSEALRGESSFYV
ncbi:chemotaxis protein histidine kinase CheA [Desulfuromonas soudanensis]|uniref:histidine kinase n=1 Tax=Desulfuromonas soudanensis TaxID=1603606 RepID=A0A0M3QFV0_9BACT|nr:chemotaxis protein CheA [Desulfuromonas soudanensis]ALC16703.1 chemotaxis protein histidine kinase CheA [Desulfuromonas soudanensis]